MAQDKTVPIPVQEDPEDFHAVQQVCTACHDTSRIMHSHTWPEWTDLLDRMSGFGAKGSDEQWDSIARSLLRTLTLVNVNQAGVDELGPVLNVSDDVAAAIVDQRSKTPFKSADELAKIPGIDPKRLEEVKPRLKF
jgi:DNA uptake protein ComE-like DNA-binding protein